ncbi:hypothetical protein NE237_010928 [Protea cynaroides]|uniref:Uncharacterized protein n=1 Tax=Protea cynaroides TaxID=273540 RepID=A0A9Q0L0H2_9MAGN|nr:hypothetical protein NE237_010928 [Protea cynaroides]
MMMMIAGIVPLVASSGQTLRFLRLLDPPDGILQGEVPSVPYTLLRARMTQGYFVKSVGDDQGKVPPVESSDQDNFKTLFLCPTAISAFPMAKLGCQETCGNLLVSYPFGIGNRNCYRDSNFELICNDTYYNPPKLFREVMANVEVEIINISLQGQFRSLHYVSRDCYNSQGNLTYQDSTRYIFYYENTFSVSDTENKFTALGCDTQAYFITNGIQSTTGCIMSCPNEHVLNNGSCNGLGCCQTSIPKGFQYMNISVSSINNHTSVQDFNPCGYAFITDYNWYNFSISDLLNFNHYKDETGLSRVPVVVDWAIGWETNITSCEEAMKNQSTYACGNNSICGVSKSGLGYSCNCSQGYLGNPYLQYGCQGT